MGNMRWAVNTDERKSTTWEQQQTCESLGRGKGEKTVCKRTWTWRGRKKKTCQPGTKGDDSDTPLIRSCVRTHVCARACVCACMRINV